MYWLHPQMYLQAENITDLSAFIFSEKKGTHKVFYRSIARDIERPLFAVYRKMLRVFDVSNHVGKWTKKNERRLLRFVIEVNFCLLLLP